MKKFLSLMLASFICLSALSGCGKKNEENKGNQTTENKKEEKKAGKKEVNVAIGKDIAELNVHNYSGDMAMQSMVYEGLVKNTEKGPIPWLAEKWEISPDGTEYTFHLRKDVKFHDGTKLDAEAVKKNFDAINRNAERHSWIAFSKAFKEVKVVDEYTVKIVLKYAYYPALMELGLTRPYRMISPAVFKNGETKDGIIKESGTGPWVLESKDPKKSATFAANKDYWGNKSDIQKITFKVMPTGQTTLLALEKGELDFLFTASGAQDLIDADAIKSLKNQGKVQVVQSKPMATRFFVISTAKQGAAITDKNVREAIWYAIDRENMIKTTLGGAEDAADTLFAKTAPYCNIDLKKRGFDVNKAKELLDKAGWKEESGKEYRMKDGKELSVKLYYYSDRAGQKQMVEFIQSNLKNVGIKTELFAEEKSGIYERRKSGDYELAVDQTWGAPYDPPSTVSAFTAQGSYLNCIKGLENHEGLIKDITEVLKSTDEKARQDLYTKILTKVHDEVAFIPLSFSKVTVIAPSSFTNIVFNQSQYEIPFEEFKFK